MRDAGSVSSFKVTRYYDGHYEYWPLKAGEPETTLSFASTDISELTQRMRKQAETLGEKLVAHASRQPAFAPSIVQAKAHIEQFVKAQFNDPIQVDNVVKTFITALTGLPGQDQAIQEDLVSASREFQTYLGQARTELSKNQALEFERMLPHFLLHSSMDEIPDAVIVSEYIAAQEKNFERHVTPLYRGRSINSEDQGPAQST